MSESVAGTLRRLKGNPDLPAQGRHHPRSWAQARPDRPLLDVQRSRVQLVIDFMLLGWIRSPHVLQGENSIVPAGSAPGRPNRWEFVQAHYR